MIILSQAWLELHIFFFLSRLGFGLEFFLTFEPAWIGLGHFFSFRVGSARAGNLFQFLTWLSLGSEMFLPSPAGTLLSRGGSLDVTVGANVSDMSNMTFDMRHLTLDCVFLGCLTNSVGVN